MTDKRSVNLNWLEDAPDRPVGVTWGVPWKEGEFTRNAPLSLTNQAGTSLPMQSWPTAYWPDGSVKWSAHAAVIPASEHKSFTIRKKTPSSSALNLKVVEKENLIEVDTGIIRCLIAKEGNTIIQSLLRRNIEIGKNGRLLALQKNAEESCTAGTYRQERFVSRVTSATVEQAGPIRCVIKLTGRHRCDTSKREWIPFDMRLYFYAGMEDIKIVHTFLYDGNPQEDFIQGLGLSFQVPMRGPLYNRHVRFVGETGVFADSPKGLLTRKTKGRYAELYRQQVKGEIICFDAQEDANFINLLDDSAVWDSFKMIQESSFHYRIAKRTKQGCSWVKAGVGQRAKGLAYAGSIDGGLSICLRNFWQKYPSSMEIKNMSTEQAVLTAWFWSPETHAMDMRHYDTETHVNSSYEGAEELRATPFGVGNTSELQIRVNDSTPTSDELLGFASSSQSPPLLICDPAYYHKVQAFGIWSLPDRSTPIKAMLEERLDDILTFYMKEVEERDWYGFWDYGDFMHSYDPIRHVWNYDLGGCAWQNTELVPNMWLWYSFLRTGRSDVFRLAEAMTRHTSEVDIHHIGEYAGLGSRHNVVHWGCGCKEARISMAGLHRYYFYLTADDRIGDIMDDMKDADYATVALDPMRTYFPKDGHPTHVRIGPDWAAFCSNWLTRWERYEDITYRDKIMTGIEDIKPLQFRLMTGPTFGYNPETSKLTYLGDDNWGRHLAICMGGPQIWFEMAQILKDAEWESMIAEFGEFYNLPPEEKTKRTNGAINPDNFHHPVLSVAIAAYGAYFLKNYDLARTCWEILLTNPFGCTDLKYETERVTYLQELDEITWMNTNEASQWSLNTIISLELIADALAVSD
jgi:hypothetical protein